MSLRRAFKLIITRWRTRWRPHWATKLTNERSNLKTNLSRNKICMANIPTNTWIHHQTANYFEFSRQSKIICKEVQASNANWCTHHWSITWTVRLDKFLSTHTDFWHFWSENFGFFSFFLVLKIDVLYLEFLLSYVDGWLNFLTPSGRLWLTKNKKLTILFFYFFGRELIFISGSRWQKSIL